MERSLRRAAVSDFSRPRRPSWTAGCASDNEAASRLSHKKTECTNAHIDRGKVREVKSRCYNVLQTSLGACKSRAPSRTAFSLAFQMTD